MKPVKAQVRRFPQLAGIVHHTPFFIFEIVPHFDLMVSLEAQTNDRPEI